MWLEELSKTKTRVLILDPGASVEYGCYDSIIDLHQKLSVETLPPPNKVEIDDDDENIQNIFFHVVARSRSSMPLSMYSCSTTSRFSASLRNILSGSWPG